MGSPLDNGNGKLDHKVWRALTFRSDTPSALVRLPAAAEIYNQFAGPGVGCAANSALPRTSRNCSAAAAVIRKLPTASIWFSVSVFETLAEDQRKRYRQNGSAESGGWNGVEIYNWRRPGAPLLARLTHAAPHDECRLL